MEQRDPFRKPARTGEPEKSNMPGDYLRAVRVQLLEDRTNEAYAVLLVIGKGASGGEEQAPGRFGRRGAVRRS